MMVSNHRLDNELVESAVVAVAMMVSMKRRYCSSMQLFSMMMTFAAAVSSHCVQSMLSTKQRQCY